MALCNTPNIKDWPLRIYLFCSYNYKKRSTHLKMSRSLTQAKERGLEQFRRLKMSLTYRGLKYTQHKAALTKEHLQLTYRGKHYQS